MYGRRRTCPLLVRKITVALRLSIAHRLREHWDTSGDRDKADSANGGHAVSHNPSINNVNPTQVHFLRRHKLAFDRWKQRIDDLFEQGETLWKPNRPRAELDQCDHYRPLRPANCLNQESVQHVWLQWRYRRHFQLYTVSRPLRPLASHRTGRRTSAQQALLQTASLYRPTWGHIIWALKTNFLPKSIQLHLFALHR